MAQPITWQNVLGPSLADASRPLEAAQRTFSGLFDNLGSLLRDTETRMETGRNILKDRNADVLRDLYARAKTPEQIAAAQQQETMLRAQFGDMLRPGDVRGLDEQRMVNVRNQLKQGWEFDNAQRDQNEFGLINSIKAKLASNDPIIRAQGEREAMAAQVRDRAALVGAATTAQREGVRWDEEKKEFVRKDEMHRDTLFDRKHQRGIEDGQLSVARANAETNQYNAQTQRSNFNLNLVRNLVDDRRKVAEDGAQLLENFGKTAQYRTDSAEGAKQLAEARDKLPEDARGVGTYLIELINNGKMNIPLGTALAAMNSAQSRYLSSDKGDAERIYEGLITAAAKGNLQNKTADFQADQYLGRIEQNKADGNNLSSLYSAIQGKQPMNLSVLNEPADRPRGEATPQATAIARNEDGVVENPTGLASPVLAAPAAPAKTALQTLQEAEAAWAKAGRRIGPEMTAMRQARTAYLDEEAAKRKAEEALIKRVGRADAKVEDTQRRLAVIQNRFNQLTEEAAKFKGRDVPRNVARLLKQDEEDIKVLKARLGIQ